MKLSLQSSFIFFLFAFNFVQSQNNLKIIYDYHVPNNGKMSEEIYSYLITNNEFSYFVINRTNFPRPETKVIQDVSHITVKVSNADDIGSYVYRDFKKDSIVFREVGSKFMPPILVVDQWESFLWEIKEEEKRIGNYICKKAIGKFRGREYTAWFAEEIPIASGPWKLFGLPGLILEAFDSKMEFYAVAKELNFNAELDKEDLKMDFTTSYTFDEYKQYRKNYKENYVNSIKSKLPRGSNLNLKPSDIKLSPIESEFE